jgi:hypothetical protein
MTKYYNEYQKVMNIDKGFLDFYIHLVFSQLF